MDVIIRTPKEYREIGLGLAEVFEVRYKGRKKRDIAIYEVDKVIYAVHFATNSIVVRYVQKQD